MGFILDISVTKLRAGDSIEFVLDVGTYKINVISPTLQTSTLEVKGTSDIVPQDNEWLVAVDRLENAISQINPVTSVSSNSTVISITFDDGVNATSFNIDDSNGSLISLVQTITTGGVVDPLGSVLVPNITITNTTHRLLEYANYTALNYPHGNMGDKLETIITFTSAGSFSVLDFYYGWTDNNTVTYPLAGQNIYQIDQSLFTDITTGALQKHTGNTGGINTVQPLQGNKVESIDLVNTGGNDYTLTLVHYIPILPRPIDRTVDNNLDKPVEIETSLKMLFQIDLKANLLEPNPTESTAKQNLTQFVGNGNIGYFNEVYQTGQQFYFLNGFVWNNSENELNSGVVSSGAITLGKIGGNFNGTHDVIVKIQKLTDQFNQSENQLQNYDFDSVQIKLDAVVQNSTILTDVQGSFSGSAAVVTFNVAPGTITSAYAIWVSVADGTANKGNQNIQVKVSDAINAADDSTVVFGAYPGSSKIEYNYNNHYQLDIADSFNQVRSYIDDFQLSRFRVVNNDLANNELVSFTIRIRNGNSILDSFKINAEDLNFSFDRDYNLDVNDPHRFVKVDDDGAGNYDFIYPFQINDNFVGLTDVVQETIAVFNQNTVVGVLEFTNTWTSPIFEFGQYDLSNNTFAEPQITAPPANIKYFNQAGTEEVGKVLNTGITKVVATFTETTLNDLQCDPAAPFTYSDNVFIDNYICAYFGIEVGAEYYRFHNLQDNGDTPFQGDFPILERVSINEATLTAFIDANDIVTTFGTDFNCLQITARIDKIQLGAPVTKAYKNSAYSSGYS